MASHDIVAPEAQPVVGPRVTNSWVLALKNMVTVRPKVLEVVLLLAVFYLLSWASARYGPSTGQQSAALDVVTKSLDRAIRDALLFSQSSHESRMINPFNLSAQLSSLAPFIDTRPSAPLIQRRLFEASLMLCRICPEIPSDVVVAPPDANCDSVAHDMKGMLFVSHNDIEAFKSSAWAVALAPQSGICFKDLVRTDLYQFWYW